MYNVSELREFMAGFDLVACRGDDGKLYSYSPGVEPIDDWPPEVVMGGITYTLDDIVYGTGGYESAIYV